jgi:acyl-CoA reductase-like NAD-dependent aldehyde dehydrogenase
MPRAVYPYFLGNEARQPNTLLEVRDKYTGEVASRVAQADDQALEEALELAARAAGPMAALSGHERAQALRHCARRLAERSEELAFNLCVEAGKPIRDAHGEVARLIDTFLIAAEESLWLGGEVLPLDRTPRGRGYVGLWRRFPSGPVAAITPFNFPLNLAAHKLAPAIAAGCPFVLKPASATPIGALTIGEILAETELPKGAFSVLPVPGGSAGKLVEDPRIKVLSFTGSPQVGWELKRRAGKKKVTLELGGNAACIVCADADLDDAVERLVFGAFYQSGQSCVSVQRILVQETVYAALRDKLVAKTRALECGDPKLVSTFVGPLISQQEAERLERWIASARARGARLLCGGKRSGAVLEATLLEGVPEDEPLSASEAFGPVALLAPFGAFEEALERANASTYGLQAGVFTRDLERAFSAWERLEVGGVCVNEVPSWRADHMPYGGVKDSGLGREGVRFAIEEYSEIRMLVLRRRS